MSINRKERILFEKWASHRDWFVCDGVVSEAHYLASKIKLCFVLKEVNDEGGGGWDLREFLRSGGRPATWDNVARWAFCIENLDEDISWQTLESLCESEKTRILRTICAMNLKKSPGTHTTERSSFSAIVREDQQFILQQYEIYDPDITVCCGTGWEFREVLGLGCVELFETSRGIKWFKDNNGCPIVIFPHPEARIQDSILAYAFVDAIREIIRITELSGV